MSTFEIVTIFMFLFQAVGVCILVGFAARVYSNWKFDKKLKIKTQGILNLNDDEKHHKTMSTPYSALSKLASACKVSPESKIVDFGSGKGRVSIVLNYFYGVDVTGVELSREVLSKSNENLKNYNENNLKKYSRPPGEVNFHLGYAEEYELKENEDVFFFFNPFHVSIFENVMANIENHALKQNKKMTVILYYPTKEYLEFLKSKNYKITKEINPLFKILPNEKFIIVEV